MKLIHFSSISVLYSFGMWICYPLLGSFVEMCRSRDFKFSYKHLKDFVYGISLKHVNSLVHCKWNNLWNHTRTHIQWKFNIFLNALFNYLALHTKISDSTKNVVDNVDELHKNWTKPIVTMNWFRRDDNCTHNHRKIEPKLRKRWNRMVVTIRNSVGKNHIKWRVICGKRWLFSILLLLLVVVDGGARARTTTVRMKTDEARARAN